MAKVNTEWVGGRGPGQGERGWGRGRGRGGGEWRGDGGQRGGGGRKRGRRGRTLRGGRRDGKREGEWRGRDGKEGGGSAGRGIGGPRAVRWEGEAREVGEGAECQGRLKELGGEDGERVAQGEGKGGGGSDHACALCLTAWFHKGLGSHLV